jgi:hypothetical protein
LAFHIALNDGLDEVPNKGDPGEQDAEIIVEGVKQGVGGVAVAAFEVIAVRAVTRFEMADDGLNR